MGIGKRDFRPRTLVLGMLSLLIAAPSGQALVEPSSPAANYSLNGPQFENWRAAKHGPIQQFVYRHPKANARVQATVTQVRASYNPNPEQTTERLARMYVENTRKKMPTFRAERLGSIEGAGVRFELVRRVGPERAMVCAFAVRGNTTAIVSLIGVGKDKALADRYAPAFRQYLKQLQLVDAAN